MKKMLLSILAVILIIEEWLWDGLSAFGHFLVGLLRLNDFERWLSQVSPKTALVAFMVPLFIVTPINLIALGLLAHGLILQGILLEIFAKLLGTLLVSRVFSLTKNQLLSFRLLAFIHANVTRWLSWAHQKITDTSIYKLSKTLKLQLKSIIAAWLA